MENNILESLLSNGGTHALHDHVSSKMETALGRAFPQMEVRFKNLSISADIVVSDHSNSKKAGLPTISNHLKTQVGRFGAKKKIVTKPILKNVNGVFKPGTTTLVIGQPRSGKSSLMKILSGRFHMRKNIQMEGEITYNGTPRTEIIKRLPQFVAYVDQRDKHYPTLSVKETLEFAHVCCGGDLPEHTAQLLTNGTQEENREALETASTMFKHYPEIVIRQLGLQDCQDTVVGDAMLRGVSGGERKRVTTGEMEFGMKYVTLMDEISTGLDSAATFDIVNTQRNIAKKFRKTVVMSLLQPSPEVFGLFDYVLILNEGEVMYHGPRDQVQSYFERLGFVCPPHRDLADFLLDLGTKQQFQYQAGKSSHPHLASEFAEIFQRSDIHDEMLRDLHGLYDPDLIRDVENHVHPMPEFHQSFWESTWTLMKRQALVTMRNKAFLKGRLLMIVMMGFLYSSVFYNFDPTDIQVVMGIIFSSALFLALGQASQIPTFMAAREVFYKQRSANFYRTSAYVLSNSMTQIPVGIAESLVFGSLIYWVCGFVADVENYAIFLGILILTNLTFGAWFFCLSAIAPDLHVAKPLSMVSVVIFVLFAGFVIAQDDIPSYLIWIFWLNPISWCFRSLAINEYMHESFNKACVYEGIDYCSLPPVGKTMGEYYLDLFGVSSDKIWVPLGCLFMILSYFIFMLMSYLVLEYIRYEAHSDSSLSPIASDSTTEPVAIVNINSTRRKVNPVTVAFENLWYSVPDPVDPKQNLDLLKGISGYAFPGTMTALMGSSGAGKTTLMDVIAGRKTGGKIKGKIFLNGYEATDLAIRRSTGYCEQMDIHSEASTFREALLFSAFLRQGGDVSDSKKYDTVAECLDLLGLDNIADKIIRGSSTEQMKRLTIGVELAAQPGVLFLDEPTSGLDARSAKVIMDGVRKVANTGRTIVCTIHQPSSEVFQLFDSLLLLKKGGETVFFGDLGKNSTEMIKYFEAIPHVPKLQNGYNPATWMLEVIGAGVDNKSANQNDFVALFNSSDKKKLLEVGLAKEGVTQPSEALPELSFQNKRAASEWLQMRLLMKRFFDMYWRTPSYNYTRFVVSLILALLFGLVYLDVDYRTYTGINAGVGMVFLTTVFIGIVSFNSVLPIAAEERPAFYRERASQTYNALWYFVGWTVAEIPYVLGSSLLFTAIFYPMVGFNGFEQALLYWMNTALHVLLQTYIGQFLAFALPSVEVAAIIGVLVNSIFFLFMGFNPPAEAIPKGYKWLYTITPQRYSLAISSAIVFSDCPTPGGEELGCQMLQNAPVQIGTVTVKQYVETVFKMKYDEIGENLAIIAGLIVAFRLFALLALRFCNHQKK